jgi:hypothetical protein
MSYLCPFPAATCFPPDGGGGLSIRLGAFSNVMGRAKIPGAAGTESLQQKRNASTSPKCFSSGFSHLHFWRDQPWLNKNTGGELHGFVLKKLQKSS